MNDLENDVEYQKMLREQEEREKQEKEEREQHHEYYRYLKNSDYGELYCTFREKNIDKELLQLLANHLTIQYFKDVLIIDALDLHSLYECLDSSDLAIFIRLILNKENPFVKFKSLVDKKIVTSPTASRIMEDDFNPIDSIIDSDLHHLSTKYFGLKEREK